MNLYQSNRTEYYRRKRISISLKRFYASKKSARKISPLYLSNRKEYYRRKRISKGLKKYWFFKHVDQVQNVKTNIFKGKTVKGETYKDYTYNYNLSIENITAELLTKDVLQATCKYRKGKDNKTFYVINVDLIKTTSKHINRKNIFCNSGIWTLEALQKHNYIIGFITDKLDYFQSCAENVIINYLQVRVYQNDKK